MMEFISNNIKFPKECSEIDIQGTVYITFIVKKNGTLDDKKILNYCGKLIRVILNQASQVR